MRRFATLVALLVLLTSITPVLACATGIAMNPQESACCREMRDSGRNAINAQCGEMAKTGCCRTEVRTDQSPRIAATAPASEVQWVRVAQLTALSSTAPPTPGISRQFPPEHLPPGLLAARVTVLRI